MISHIIRAERSGSYFFYSNITKQMSLIRKDLFKPNQKKLTFWNLAGLVLPNVLDP